MILIKTNLKILLFGPCNNSNCHHIDSRIFKTYQFRTCVKHLTTLIQFHWKRYDHIHIVFFSRKYMKKCFFFICTVEIIKSIITMIKWQLYVIIYTYRPFEMTPLWLQRAKCEEINLIHFKKDSILPDCTTIIYKRL